MSEWKEHKLGELFDFSSGLSKNRKYFGYGFDFVSFKDVFDNYYLPDTLTQKVDSNEKERNAASIKRGDVFLTRTSETMDELGMSSVALKDYENATFNGFTKRLRAKEKNIIVPEFAAFLFRSPDFRTQISKFSIMTTRASLNNEIMSQLKVRLPDLKTQKEIGEILISLSRKIELNNQINANLEALAQAIFKQWFIDFEFPDENGNPYKSSGGKMVESELGEIPKDWCLKSLYETACFMNGAAFKSEHFSADRGGLPIIKIVELKYGISPQTAYSVLEFDPKYRIDNGSVLYSWSGSPETSLEVFKWFGGAGWLNQHIFKVTTNNLAQEIFVYYLLRFLKPKLVAIAKDKQTTGLGHVTVADMKRLKVAYPCNKALLKFQQTVESIYYQHSSNELETKSLKELRDILLPKLISGQISVA